MRCSCEKPSAALFSKIYFPRGVLPVAAIRMAAVARSSRPAPSPWLQPTASERYHLRLLPPPPSRWARVPLFGSWLERLFGEGRFALLATS